MGRTLSDVAKEIRQDWRNPYFGAIPYLQAMETLDDIGDHYGADSGETIVLYFLSNASTWKGEVARKIKKELRGIAKLI